MTAGTPYANHCPKCGGIQFFTVAPCNQVLKQCIACRTTEPYHAAFEILPPEMWEEYMRHVEVEGRATI